MRADICNATDDVEIQRFRTVLRDEGAILIDKSGGAGVDMYVF